MGLGTAFGRVLTLTIGQFVARLLDRFEAGMVAAASSNMVDAELVPGSN